MGKVYFRYGAMGSSKTANALMTLYNYHERGKNVVLLKPACDVRDGDNIVRSRIGLEAKSITIESFLDFEVSKMFDAIIVDESQFASEKQIEKLVKYSDNFEVPVIFYGLKTDFQGHLFEGSKRLLELADELEEIPTICWCGRKARFNARIIDGKIARDGEQFYLGANESYTSLCRQHFMEGKIKPDEGEL